MSDSPPPFDLPKAHRWFGVEFNNCAWELVDKPFRTPEEADEMIHAAHASYLHWQRVGTPVNRQRGLNLLAAAYLAIGCAPAAAYYAECCLKLSDQNGDTQTPFDRASAYGCAARASALAKDSNKAEKFRRLADQAAVALTDAEEKEVFSRLWGE